MELTPQCRQAVEHAREAAIRFGEKQVSTAHLIVGLLAVRRGVAELLTKAGLTLDTAENYVRANPARSDDAAEGDQLAFERSVSAVFERAEQEARNGKCRYLGTDHVLLAMCAEDTGHARGMLDALHIDRARVRELVIERLSVPPPFDLSQFDSEERP